MHYKLLSPFLYQETVSNPYNVDLKRQEHETESFSQVAQTAPTMASK